MRIVAYMYPERATGLLPRRESCVDLVAGKAIVVSIKVDSETIGRSRPIEVRAVHIDSIARSRSNLAQQNRRLDRNS